MNAGGPICCLTHVEINILKKKRSIAGRRRSGTGPNSRQLSRATHFFYRVKSAFRTSATQSLHVHAQCRGICRRPEPAIAGASHGKKRPVSRMPFFQETVNEAPRADLYRRVCVVEPVNVSVSSVTSVYLGNLLKFAAPREYATNNRASSCRIRVARRRKKRGSLTR